MIGIFYILIAVFFESAGHICLKQAADGDPARKNPFEFIIRAIGDKKTTIGIACFVLEFCCWTLVLQRLEVGLAYQLGCMSFVSVAILSRIFLGEQLDKKRWIGIFFILAGSVLVGAS